MPSWLSCNGSDGTMRQRAKSATRWAAWLMLMSLPSCAPGSPAATDCAWARVILIDPADVLSPATARQLLAHNLRVDAICPR